MKFQKGHRINNGRVRSEEYKKKMSEAKKGVKRPEGFSARMSKLFKSKGISKGSSNPNWKGGITPINKKLRNSEEYKLWRKAVFERDKYICVWCKVSGAKAYLHADHIKPFAFYPELRFAIDNGRTLCKSCHRKTDTYGRF